VREFKGIREDPRENDSEVVCVAGQRDASEPSKSDGIICKSKGTVESNEVCESKGTVVSDEICESMGVIGNAELGRYEVQVMGVIGNAELGRYEVQVVSQQLREGLGLALIDSGSMISLVR
jgi:hypothetical protein